MNVTVLVQAPLVRPQQGPNLAFFSPYPSYFMRLDGPTGRRVNAYDIGRSHWNAVVKIFWLLGRRQHLFVGRAPFSFVTGVFFLNTFLPASCHLFGVFRHLISSLRLVLKLVSGDFRSKTKTRVGLAAYHALRNESMETDTKSPSASGLMAVTMKHWSEWTGMTYRVKGRATDFRLTRVISRTRVVDWSTDIGSVGNM